MQGRVLQRWRSSASGFGVDGLSEGEVEVMHLREENEALMDSLVRTKVDLAETEGEHLSHLPCSCCLGSNCAQCICVCSWLWLLCGM